MTNTKFLNRLWSFAWKDGSLWMNETVKLSTCAGGDVHCCYTFALAQIGMASASQWCFCWLNWHHSSVSKYQSNIPLTIKLGGIRPSWTSENSLVMLVSPLCRAWADRDSLPHNIHHSVKTCFNDRSKWWLSRYVSVHSHCLSRQTYQFLKQLCRCLNPSSFLLVG